MVWMCLPKARLSPEQRLTYVERGLEVEAGLEEAVRLLRLKGIVAADEGERDRLARRANQFEEARASVHVDLISYLEECSEICPLDAAAAETIHTRARLLFGLSPQSAAHVIIGVAQDLVDRWGFTRPFPLRVIPGGSEDTRAATRIRGRGTSPRGDR